MLRLISPLLEAPGLIQECGFAFKFFLPQNIEAPMRTQNIGRLDRIPSYSLTWTIEQLCDMLSKRLETYSLISSTNPTPLVSRFSDLCAVDFDVDQQLAHASNTSPRRMLDLARRIVVEHCTQANSPKRLIAKESIMLVLQNEGALPEIPTVQAESYEPSIILTTASALLIPQLSIDERGDVWLGATRKNAPLSPLLRKCLAYLWLHRHRNISYEDLQNELYGESVEERGDPRSSCEKLVRRLREYLEKGRPSSHNYIDIQAGFGYVLRNFREE